MSNKRTRILHELTVIGGDDAADAGRDRMRDIGTEAGDLSEAADLLALVCGEMSLGAVLYDLQSMALSDLDDRIHFARLTKQMHGHDRDGLIIDGVLEQFGVEIIRARIDIDKARLKSGMQTRIR